MVTYLCMILCLIFETVVVMGYITRRKNRKGQDEIDPNPDVKRSRKELIKDVAKKLRLVHQQSKYHKYRCGKINKVVNNAQDLFTWITEK